MKSVLISIQPKWVEKICHEIGEENGKPIYEKVVEVRTTKPKIETPFRAYVYQSKKFVQAEIGEANKYRPFLRQNQGKVIGEFVCDRIEDFSKWEFDYPSLLRHINLYAGTNGDYKFLDNYLKGEKYGYGWHISDLKIYDKPKELSEFYRDCPQYYSSYEEGICAEMCVWYDMGICKNFSLPITRPPQSWCYVESLGE
jgi:predicted transcriptional regulator